MTPSPHTRVDLFVAALLGSAGLVTGAAWGFLEATVFFIVPDIIISCAALFSFRRSIAMLGAVLGGSLVGGAVMFLWGASDFESGRWLVSHVPFVSPAMFNQARSDLTSSGMWGLCAGPMSGIPYKVYSIQAHEFGGIFLFLLVSIPARLERLVISWGVFSAFGLILRKRSAHLRLIVHVLYWIIIYAMYWGKFQT